jgi:hypothetical protein
LRQLVDAIMAQETPDARDPLITRARAIPSIMVMSHGPQLKNSGRSAAETSTLLTGKLYRAGRLELDGSCTDARRAYTLLAASCS